MKTTYLRILIAGIAGGLVMNLVMFITFRLIGFGWNGGGILLDPSRQSKKLIKVWTELYPLPLVINTPAPIIIGLIFFGVVHAYIFHRFSSAWKGGIICQGIQFSILVFVMSFLFWEFFTPFNMFGGPLSLIALELLFWACIALAEGLTIALIIGSNSTNSKR